MGEKWQIIHILLIIDKFKRQLIADWYQMRFFLKIKQNGKQVGLKRIESKHELQNTDQLLALIQKSLSIDPGSFIARFISDQYRFRIINGWSLKDYSIRSGLQLEVQILNSTKQHIVDTENSTPDNVGQVQFNKQEMPKIIEEDEEQAEKSSQISHMVQKKYEQLLKMIQKNNTDGYMKEIKQNCNLGPCENEYYRKQLLAIQNELGAQGWAAIHYAVFAGNVQIVNFLIEIGVDVNNKTSDEWLPIQLAVRQQNYAMIDLLVAQPALNINICTAHGLVLNMAIQSSNMKIISKLLMKDVNFSARDHLGRTVYEVMGPTPDKDLCEMLNRQERRQSLTNVISEKNVMYHALITSYRGEVVCIKMPPRKNKQYYLCINPYENAIKIFEEKAHYPQFPKQLIPISIVSKFKEMNKSQKSWYMKNDLFYFIVASPKTKYTFGCHFEATVTRWIQAFNQCQEHVAMYPESIKQFERNDSVIMDRLEEATENKRKMPTSKSGETLMSLFTSKCSQRTEESPDKNSRLMNPELKNMGSNQSPDKKQKEKQQQQQNKNQKLKSSSTSTQAQPSPSTPKNGVKYADFKILKTLGEGSFGTVFLAVDMRNPQKKKHYALKCFKKKKLVINKQIKYTIAELNILKQLSHPFIVNLHFTFQTPNYVYLGLDYCPNKDMSHHLMNEVTFPEKEAMIYTAEILLALEYLHSKNIIYRDLKPENIMLDERGHVRLVDFGLSKQGQDREFVAKSFCGSPAYLSPQMLVKKGVGRESDFYCLGAVLYEMLVGEPPFFSDDIKVLYQNISSSKLSFPKSLSNEAKSLLIGLLERDPQKRLGYKGAEQIKSHPFFKDVNWGNLLKKSTNAPVREEIQLEQEDDSLVVQSSHKDFDYCAENYKINRFLNFSFIRQQSPIQ